MNKYLENSRLGLHQDNTEKNLKAPIISISLGATGIFGSSGFCVETRSILIEYPQNSPKSLAQ
ncbi:alpha-ketoglutarate-dependent dioxygenase AlkB [Microcystis sp. LSC13-02]|uniref:alpha-ketoglutarate-dependent dioxygenase AlkB n=1 Tax=Microcystis sp. LSC13-02 TaxID=1895004 RepID=UPI00338D861D